MTNQKSKNLEMIYKTLDEAKNDEVRNLNLIKFHQERKIVSVNRLISYKREYEKKDSASSFVVPALLANKQEFLKKLDQAIIVETKQVEVFEHEKISSIAKIDSIDCKLKAIQVLIDKNQTAIKLRDEEIAISDDNELAVRKMIKDHS
jgi:flagellar biosynthesis chaperone FliJ